MRYWIIGICILGVIASHSFKIIELNDHLEILAKAVQAQQESIKLINYQVEVLTERMHQ